MMMTNLYFPNSCSEGLKPVSLSGVWAYECGFLKQRLQQLTLRKVD